MLVSFAALCKAPFDRTQLSPTFAKGLEKSTINHQRENESMRKEIYHAYLRLNLNLCFFQPPSFATARAKAGACCGTPVKAALKPVKHQSPGGASATGPTNG
jgi:hypothetical protein